MYNAYKKLDGVITPHPKKNFLKFCLDSPPFKFGRIFLAKILYFFFHIQDYMIMEKFTKKKNQELIKFKNMIENYIQK